MSVTSWAAIGLALIGAINVGLIVLACWVKPGGRDDEG